MEQTAESMNVSTELARWFCTPPGRYLLEWEQAQLDSTLIDFFGFHAAQLGVPELDALRANRMPHRWLALDSMQQYEPLASARVQSKTQAESRSVNGPDTHVPINGVALRCAFDALPFATQSLDLVVLPHTLELGDDPHETLREVERVLVPEGRVVIIGMNPTSLWGLRQSMGALRRRLGWGGQGGQYLPSGGEFIGFRRLRDWLRLLAFQVEGGKFGCYRPPVRSEKWLNRFAWMEKAGDRWWPVFGSVYFLVAIKRVHGMRLVGLVPKVRGAAVAAPAVAVHHNQKTHESRSQDQ